MAKTIPFMLSLAISLISLVVRGAAASAEGTLYTWEDASGKFSVEAELLGTAFDSEAKITYAKLRKKDGSVLAVDVRRLNETSRRQLIAIVQKTRPKPERKKPEEKPVEEKAPVKTTRPSIVDRIYLRSKFAVAVHCLRGR